MTLCNTLSCSPRFLLTLFFCWQCKVCLIELVKWLTSSTCLPLKAGVWAPEHTHSQCYHSLSCPWKIEQCCSVDIPISKAGVLLTKSSRIQRSHAVGKWKRERTVWARTTFLPELAQRKQKSPAGRGRLEMTYLQSDLDARFPVSSTNRGWVRTRPGLLANPMTPAFDQSVVPGRVNTFWLIAKCKLNACSPRVAWKIVQKPDPLLCFLAKCGQSLLSQQLAWVGSWVSEESMAPMHLHS